MSKLFEDEEHAMTYPLKNPLAPLLVDHPKIDLEELLKPPIGALLDLGAIPVPKIDIPVLPHENFVEEEAFKAHGPDGIVARFKESPFHVSLPPDRNDHLTLEDRSLHKRHDFSNPVKDPLKDFREMGGLEKRVSVLDAWENSILNPRRR